MTTSTTGAPPVEIRGNCVTCLRPARTKLEATYWRLIKHDRPRVSIFDHRQRYGLPAPVDSVAVLRDEIQDRQVIAATMSPTTGDLRFRFEGGATLEVFNFTADEIWTLTFADGTAEYSNFALPDR